MIHLDKEENKNNAFLNTTITYLENKGFENIKADVAGYETPTSFTRQETGNTIIPDIVAEKRGIKYFFEVSLKSTKPQLLKTKWLLLDTLTKMKDYRFRIITTKGHLSFTRDMIADTNLNKSYIRI
ncbi:MULTISPECIES: hypothetical protein [Dokdonia]|jgi:hypothetical protein|uniref:Uncharacterized protein n=2 Tax=Dokdonia TaxID=326319 RepID=A0A0A2GX97_9FLAO|nr:hypothetical protein [Dokdonia donghaensis]ANH60609.1 hypothetical protein I597_1705 [Dokdonia donghaensis DSW-1]KGO07854.1 hypothetical protein NV36_14095 [Dokdonia donghaensis DSW-1]MDE0599844.1 hypothetical protein [Dokdonia donghaensis]